MNLPLPPILGDLPFAEKISRMLMPHRHVPHYQMPALEKHAAEFNRIIQSRRHPSTGGKKIFLFGAHYYWTEYCTALGAALAALGGHRITVGYFSYPKSHLDPTAFDIRCFNRYTRNLLGRMGGWLNAVSLLDIRQERSLPQELEHAVDVVSLFDTQYLLQVEEVDRECPQYRLRWERNNLAARLAYHWLKNDRPDLILVPNSSVLEYSLVFRAARLLEIPTVTFEFNENREEIWLAQDDDIMRQNTDSLWLACKDRPLTEKQNERIVEMEKARMGARSFGKSERLWQDTPRGGGEQARQELGLNERPIVLLATNVLGDSLVLGRDVFCNSMADWILHTIEFFASHPQIQLIIRVHPGERFMTGPSMVDAIHQEYPQLPENVRLVGPLDKINTYDLMEIICLGLTYTTTTGLEMAMNHIPVVVAGDTHYRGRGFTLDAGDWQEYYQLLEKVPAQPEAYALTEKQVELAWRYAYHFFFTFPLPFPWHLVGFAGDLEKWPLERVLSPEGQVLYGQTFRYLAGEPLDWNAVIDRNS